MITLGRLIGRIGSGLNTMEIRYGHFMEKRRLSSLDSSQQSGPPFLYYSSTNTPASLIQIVQCYDALRTTILIFASNQHQSRLVQSQKEGIL